MEVVAERDARRRRLKPGTHRGACSRVRRGRELERPAHAEQEREESVLFLSASVQRCGRGDEDEIGI